MYNEAKTIGRDFARLSKQLVNLRKRSRVAVMVSNEALSAMEWFKLPDGKTYNDVVRWMYDELYKMNVECDFIQPSSERLGEYSLIVVPALYAVPDDALERLNAFVKGGGHAVYSFKSGFTDENVKVRTSQQPGIIGEACGVSYSMFAEPKTVGLTGGSLALNEEAGSVGTWMELLTPTTAETEVLAAYDHPQWGQYAAITRNRFGQGTATYVGCMTSPETISRVLKSAVQEAGLWGDDQELAFPLIVKTGLNADDRRIRYYFNYSSKAVSFRFAHSDGRELLANVSVAAGEQLEIEPWGVRIGCKRADL